MARILSFHNAPKTPADATNLANYMAALYEAVNRMDGFTFEMVCKDLANNMARGQKPMPSQFWAVYHKIKGEQNAGKVDFCDSCKSTCWVFVHMVNAKTGQEGDFAIPCPKCQHRHPYKDAQPRAGWTIQDTPEKAHEAQLLEMAEKLGPRGARHVLDLMEKFKVNFPQDVVLKLIDKAGNEPSLGAVGPDVKVLESLKVTTPVTINGEQYEVEE
jgi:hypothetical protein